MTIFKIIACIVLVFVSLYVGFLHEGLRELKDKATDKEKKEINIIEIIAFFSPILVAMLLVNME